MYLSKTYSISKLKDVLLDSLDVTMLSRDVRSEASFDTKREAGQDEHVFGLRIMPVISAYSVSGGVKHCSIFS